jgi:hypothetical protein
MPDLRRLWSSPWLLVVGWVVLLIGLAALLDTALVDGCGDDGMLYLTCSGPPPAWAIVLAFAYALGLLYLSLRRWINRPTDEDPLD